MRVTNAMISNSMMLNINRNAGNLNTLYNRWASGKQIQFPSEDPITASRILKFRTTLAQNLQYQKNVKQGISWMEVTESGYKESESIMSKIRELLTDNNGTYTYEDSQSLATQIKSLAQQLGLAMNANYTGRYLFSGYRTDEPPTLLADDPNLEYTKITQHFTKSDIEKTIALEKDTVNDTFNDKAVSIIKLPYKNVTNINIELNGTGTPLPGPGTITTVNSSAGNAYSPAANEIFYVEDTGELVLGADYTDSSNALYISSGIKIEYDKKGFEKGELNPKAYFTCTDPNTSVTYTMDSQKMQYEFSEGTRFEINSLAKDIITDKLYADLMNFCDTVLNVKTSDLDDVKARIKTSNPLWDEDKITQAAKDFIEEESQKAVNMLHSRFSNMLTIMDKHAANVSKSQTDLGARMNRLEMIQVRLEADEESFTELLSQNEDADLVETSMHLSDAQAAYQASLQVGMNIMRASLANFL